MSRLNLQTMGYSSMSEICFHTVKLFGMEMLVYVYRATNKLKNVMRDTKPPKKLLKKILKSMHFILFGVNRECNKKDNQCLQKEFIIVRIIMIGIFLMTKFAFYSYQIN